jgi:uncharacterized membrane protein YkvA (DUF1232 family)
MTDYKKTLNSYKFVSDPGTIMDKIDLAWDKAKGLDPDLENLMTQVELFVKMTRAYLSGDYRNIAQNNIILLLAGILYFINPFDLIPDFIPLIGLGDDAAVLIFIAKKMQHEIEKFENWESEGKIIELK